MKKKIGIGIIRSLLFVGLLFFILPESALAQTGEPVQKRQKFSKLDLNGDGHLSQNEYSNGPFGQYDLNGDQQLSKKEYRKMNKARKNSLNGNADGARQQKRLKDGSGDGQQKMNKTNNQGNRTSSYQGMRGQNAGNRSGTSGRGRK